MSSSASRVFRFVVSGVVLFGFGALASAEDAKHKSQTVSFRFLKFSEVPEICAVGTDGKYVPIEAHPGFFGKPVRLRTGEPVKLFRRGEDGNPVKEGDKPAPPIGVLSPLDVPKQIVVLFGNGAKIEPRAVPDMPNRFPYGRVLAINLTDAPFSAEIGGAPSKVPAMGATLCDLPTRMIGENNMAVRFYTTDQAHKRFYSSVWVHDAKVRTLAFIYRNEAGQILVRTIVDAYVKSFDEADPESPVKKSPAKN